VLQMMGCGAKILQVPAVEMAAEHKVKLAVGNSKTGVAGTILTDRPLGRRTLTAVIVTEDVRCVQFDSIPNLLKAVNELREAGCSPLIAGNSGGNALLILKREEEIARELFPAPIVPHEPLSLVSLIGPGVGSVSDLAETVQRKLAPYRDQIASIYFTESRLSVLLPMPAARKFAEAAHDLCLMNDLASPATARPL
jgi:aspartokinase